MVVRRFDRWRCALVALVLAGGAIAPPVAWGKAEGLGLGLELGAGAGAGAGQRSKDIEHVSTEAWVEFIEGQWERTYEEYFGRDLPAGSPDPEDIRATLTVIDAQAQTRTALIYGEVEVFRGRSYLKVVVTTGQSSWEHRLAMDVTAAQVATQVRSLRSQVTGFQVQGLVGDGGLDLRPAQQLYDWIIRPIAARLEADGIEQLVFCMGEGLRTVPLAALHDGERFLIERYAIAQIPGFTLLDAQAIGSHRASGVLAMGASEFGDLAPLPGVPLELTAIAERFQAQGGGSRQVLNEGFTAANLQRQRQRGEKIVHLATHADFRAGPVTRSFVRFWDEALSLDQLRSLDWATPPVQLLVLSACRTAVGDRDAELGFAGLAVAAGVPTAIASLWTVSDLGTLALMDTFYDRLTTAPSATVALRQAQLDLLEGRVRIENGQLRRRDGTQLALPDGLSADGTLDLTHPFHWAAFMAIGNPW
jgi:CHAT domain-containing protein